MFHSKVAPFFRRFLHRRNTRLAPGFENLIEAMRPVVSSRSWLPPAVEVNVVRGHIEL